jgi:hypothetical protein
MWWLPAATDAAAGLLPGGAMALGLDLLPSSPAVDSEEEGAEDERGGRRAGGKAAGIGESAAELLQLAAAQRMNTDVRKVRGAGGGRIGPLVKQPTRAAALALHPGATGCSTHPTSLGANLNTRLPFLPSWVRTTALKLARSC